MKGDVAKVLDDCLKVLHLPAVRENYASDAEMARSESHTYEQYLLELMQKEEVNRPAEPHCPLASCVKATAGKEP